RPSDLLPQQNDPKEKILALSARRQQTRDQINQLKQKMIDHPDFNDLLDVLISLRNRDRELTEQLTAAEAEGASPIAEAWGECQTLVSCYQCATEKDKVQIRLRTVLRRLVDKIYLLIVGSRFTKRV